MNSIDISHIDQNLINAADKSPLLITQHGKALYCLERIESMADLIKRLDHSNSADIALEIEPRTIDLDKNLEL